MQMMLGRGSVWPRRRRATSSFDRRSARSAAPFASVSAPDMLAPVSCPHPQATLSSRKKLDALDGPPKEGARYDERRAAERESGRVLIVLTARRATSAKLKRVEELGGERRVV